ncbi:MAG: Fe-S cluster assembly protein SufB [Patescibacteria group bacterium]|nr:Fe-S cluster assembly protein SufB [Patescibacteria group bacterium]
MNPPTPASLKSLDLRTLSANDGEIPVVRVAPGETLVAFAVPELEKPVSCCFELAEGAKLFLRSLVRPGTSAEVAVFLLGDRSEADVRAVAVSEAGKPSAYSSRTVSTASNTRASSDVAAFSMSGGDLSVTTVAEIGEGVFGAYAEAVQSSVLFGNSGKVRGIPELRIGSDDVKARHSCSVERFSDEKLFYLRSRGLSESDAVASLVAAKTSSAFSGLPENFVSLSENLCQSAISIIVSAESNNPSQG